MRNLIYTLIALSVSLPTFAAASALNGEVFVAAGTTGTNALPSSKTTNATVLAKSTVTNDTTAIAFKVDTANSLANDNGSKLAAFSNNGTNVFTLYPSGAIYAGQSTYNVLGEGAISQYVFANYHDVAAGDYDGAEVDITVLNGSALTTFDLYIDSTFGNLTLRNTSGGVSSYVLFDVTPNTPKFALRVGSTRRTDFLPAVADGASAVAYKLDTTVALANAGAKLLSVQNNSAERLAVAAASTAGQTSLFLWDQDNNTLERVTVGAADSGGVGFKVLRVPN
jgi:hypothetical protein